MKLGRSPIAPAAMMGFRHIPVGSSCGKATSASHPEGPRRRLQCNESVVGPCDGAAQRRQLAGLFPTEVMPAGQAEQFASADATK
jgi:hypothetical protein